MLILLPLFFDLERWYGDEAHPATGATKNTSGETTAFWPAPAVKFMLDNIVVSILK